MSQKSAHPDASRTAQGHRSGNVSVRNEHVCVATDDPQADASGTNAFHTEVTFARYHTTLKVCFLDKMITYGL